MVEANMFGTNEEIKNTLLDISCNLETVLTPLRAMMFMFNAFMESHPLQPGYTEFCDFIGSRMGECHDICDQACNDINAVIRGLKNGQDIQTADDH